MKKVLICIRVKYVLMCADEESNSNPAGEEGKSLEPSHDLVGESSILESNTHDGNFANEVICASAPLVSLSDCVVRELSAHKQEVCGLKWSFDEKQLASGGNDNKLYVWNMLGTGHDGSQRRPGTISPEYKFVDHTAAVKAIAWSPHQVWKLLW